MKETRLVFRGDGGKRGYDWKMPAFSAVVATQGFAHWKLDTWDGWGIFTVLEGGSKVNGTAQLDHTVG